MFSPCLLLTLAVGAAPADESKSRTFEFTYAATVSGLKPQQSARIWLPVPTDNDEQKIEIVTPLANAKLTKEKFYGNRLYYLEAKADADGKIPLRMAFKVTRKEVHSLTAKDSGEDAAKIGRFLQADKLVPIDGKPLDLIKDKELPKDDMAKAKALYDLVNKHMKYNKDGTGWGHGDAVWACENGRGNCSDFHSLFIALTRSQKIPARFECGFGLPPKRGEGDIAGYHCWAKLPPLGWWQVAEVVLIDTKILLSASGRRASLPPHS
jgi:transglutaminase-like putative cysteine protease